jgi:hypothetical protein
MERFFSVIARVNQLLLLLVLLAAAASIAWMNWEGRRARQRSVVAEVPAGPDGRVSLRLSLDHLSRIHGTDMRVMLLSAESGSRKFSSGGHRGEVRNVLFFSGAEKASRWLFKDHRQSVSMSQLRLGEEELTRALYVAYVRADSNGDGELSFEDRSNVALARPDGTDMVEVLRDIDQVIEQELFDAQHLSIVYRKGVELRHAKVALASAKIESDQVLVQVPQSLEE